MSSGLILKIMIAEIHEQHIIVIQMVVVARLCAYEVEFSISACAGTVNAAASGIDFYRNYAYIGVAGRPKEQRRANRGVRAFS